MKAIQTLAVALTISMIGAMACGAEPSGSDAAKKNAAALKANAKTFQLRLTYVGESGKPYYGLLLTVPKVERAPFDGGFFQIAQISEADAVKIIDVLSKSTLDLVVDQDAAAKLPEPRYMATATAGDLQLVIPLGWGREMFKHLDGLRSVLEGDAAKKMDTLLVRLSGHREKAAPTKDGK